MPGSSCGARPALFTAASWQNARWRPHWGAYGGRARDTADPLTSIGWSSRAAATGLPTLADPGYDGAGIGIHIPLKQPPGNRELDIGSRTRNTIQRSLRCLGERGFALLTQRWRTLQHITASPSKIGDIARAALVLTHFEHGYIK